MNAKGRQVATACSLLVALSVFAFQAVASSDQREAFPIKIPNIGDAALYKFHYVAKQGGTTSTDSIRLVLQWIEEEVVVPGGTAERAPTIRSSIVGNGASVSPPAGRPARELSLLGGIGLNPGRDYAAADPLVIQDLAIHLDSVPGHQRARTIVWQETPDNVDHPQTQWTQRTEFAAPCDLRGPEAVIAALSGRNTDEAKEFLQGCGGSVDDLDGRWSVSFPGANIILSVDQSSSLPTRVEYWTHFRGGSLQSTFTLVGFRFGPEPFEKARFPISPPSVRIVDWTREGPLTGDLLEHPLREAQNAVQDGNADAAAFFRGHQEARILFATHAWVSPELSVVPKKDPWAGRIKGIRCDAVTPIEGGASGDWTTSWVGDGASVFTIANRQPLHEAPLGTGASALERVVAVDTDDYGILNSGLPALRAPAPQDLSKRRGDLDALRNSGIDSIDYAFAPTAAGNIQGAAAISRGTCNADPSSGRVTYDGTSIWFIEGRPTAIVTTSIHRNEPPTLPLGLETEPQPTRKGRVPPVIPLLAGTAMIAGGVAVPFVPRLVSAAYTRLAKPRLLHEPKRAAIMAAITREPGILIQQLARQLKVPRNTLGYHVKILQRHGLLSRVRTREGLRHFPAELGVDRHLRTVTRRHATEILEVVVQQPRPPGLRQTEIAGRVGMAKTHLSSLLRSMEAEGLVARLRRGRSVFVVAGPNAGPALRGARLR